ncbi:hypothetical protein M3Y98_01006600 [Aphelenchoides besseyi]|nr:hypothetical protein M3Y98_01006600 [Aphelenchoides besseyi]KAI6195208.1 hypothetical protein M3Y96_01206500 [Aphelenchoides besseyi]
MARFSLRRLIFVFLITLNVVLFYFCCRVFYLFLVRQLGPVYELQVPVGPVPQFKVELPIRPKTMLVMLLSNRQSTSYAYESMIYDILTNPFCPQKCHYTIDRSDLHRAEGVFLQPSEITQDGPKRQSANQKFFIFLHEAPGHSQTENFKWLAPNQINYTVGFVPGCDIYAAYGQFVPKGTDSFGQQPQQLKPTELDAEWESVKMVVWSKTEPAFAVVSHCKTQSNRELYLNAFQQLVCSFVIIQLCSRRYPELLRLFGECYSGRCEQIDCLAKNTETYHFYFAFENAICSRYVTEKFIERIKGLTVPVVLRRADYQHLLPNTSYIAVDDFERMQDLASYLTMLMRNKALYLSYFDWTRHYERNGPRQLNRALCEACTKLYDTEHQSTYNDIARWYSMERFCDPNFVPSILKRHLES